MKIRDGDHYMRVIVGQGVDRSTLLDYVHPNHKAYRTIMSIHENKQRFYASVDGLDGLQFFARIFSSRRLGP